jgi:hypothetical protein
MEYLGRVHHGRIDLENNARLPEGSQVLVVILDEQGNQPEGITGAELLAAEFIGEWKDRDDIVDTAEYVEELRRKSQKRG